MSSPFRFIGAIAHLSADDRRTLFDRSTSADDAVRTQTADIVRRVQRDGDAALRELAARFDGVTLQQVEVPRVEWERAREAMAPALRASLERTVRNVRAAHVAFLPTAVEVETEPGVIVGRRPDPLQRVGVYAPGGRAAYPSSLIMGVVPAKVAGVQDVIVCSPPSPNGLPSDVVLAAAAIAGADRVFAIGGAGAIAAMAHGTASVPRVDRIVGPGNAYVAEAKLQCAGAVAIDSPAGPSELLVIADDSVDPAIVAREMLAQAEHDPRAAVVCVALGSDVATAVRAAIDALLPTIDRRDIVADAFAFAGAVLSADTLDEAVTFANQWAAEHLLLALAPGSIDVAFARLRGAGTVFLGEAASVAFGDYMTGANHVLPTGGLSRCYSGLSTLDFIRWTSWQRVTPAAAASLAPDVGRFADSEGLPNHAVTARQWSSAT
ncbi:MAG: histidinol dehydrogenase [Gemmatimonadota bacterium]